MKSKLKCATFYGIVDLGYVKPERVAEVARGLIEGGAGVVQLRAKGVAKEEVEELAKELQEVCREGGVPFIVNDYPEIALRVGADGVHIGQDDGSLAGVREVVGDEMIVGRSTHSPAQAEEAMLEGFDYIGFGPLFPTPTKQGRPGIGMQDVARVQSLVGGKIPVFCIGGVRRDNLSEVVAAGAKRVVVVSDVLLADSVCEASSEVVRKLNE
ncbi:thiamine phosphate synthase [Rubritalea tangerina]|uniref:Thiamine-phosphate synthase n=1 Tax=Rubritalea tangerina TaxID=430798 RepID=A0ABW4ZEI9_9BACT